MQSAIYTGRLRHRRFAPRAHQFSYRLFMMFVDLAEVDQIFARRWLWSAARPALARLKRSDYLGDANVPLDQAVRDRVEAETGLRPVGPIRMLAHLRYFGLGFNPVTFYYCYDTDDNVDTIVAEITNTPWLERHVYVLSSRLNVGVGDMNRFRFRKDFHVSPFLAMDYDYDWRFNSPSASSPHLTVHMENRRTGAEGTAKTFDATLILNRREINGRSLASTLLSFPLMTMTVLGGIYWQALRLWLKRMPRYSHPSKNLDHERDSSTPSLT